MPGSKRHAALVPVAALATVLFASAPAMAAAPTNDDFGNATVVTSLPYSDTASTVEATRSPDDPSCGGGGSIWYAYTPSVDGTLIADTIGSGFDTLLGVYTGQRGSLTEVGCDDDSGGALTSQVAFAATAGTTYYFVVDGYNGASGNVAFHLQPAPDPVTSVTVEITRGTVDRHGVVTLYGTVTCDQTASVVIDVVASQVHRHFTSSGVAYTGSVPCGTTPTAWSASMVSSTGIAFVAGKTSLDYFGGASNGTGDAFTTGHLVLTLTGTH